MSDQPEKGTLSEAEWFGANARARGEGVETNPFHAPVAEAMYPDVAWRLRLSAAWEIGWRVEDAMRGGTR